MNDVEKKLAKYRAQKDREAKYNKFKVDLKNRLASYFASREINKDKEVILHMKNYITNVKYLYYFKF